MGGTYPENVPTPWQATTFADLIQRQAPGLQVLAQIRAYQAFNAWTATGGRAITWQVPVLQYTTVHNVRQIDTVKVSDPATVVATPLYAFSSNAVVTNQVVPYSLTIRASVALVDANPGSFYHDLTAGILYISLPTSATPVVTYVLAGFLLYFSPGATIIAQGVIDAAGNHYWPYLHSVPEIRRGVSNAFFGVMQQGTSQLSLISASGLLDSIFALYQWASGDVTVLMGGESLPIASYQSFQMGKIEKASWDESVITFDILDATQQLLTTFPKTLFIAADATTKIVLSYASNTPAPFTELGVSPVDVEPTASTTRVPIDSPKPVLYGRKVNIKPVCLARTTSSSSLKASTWMVAHHPCQYIENVVQGGLTSPNSNGGGGDMVSAFQWLVSGDNSIIHISGAASWDATQQIYVTARGKMNPDGSLMTNPADIVQDILTVEGPGSAYPLDQSILADSRFVGDAYEVALYFSISEGTAPVRVIDAIDQICKDTLSYFYLTLSNVYAFRTWWPSVASQATMDEAWGDFLSSKVSEDASNLYETILCEYGENSLLYTTLFSSFAAEILSTPPPPPLQRGPTNYSLVTINRPECAAVIQDRTVSKTMTATIHQTQASAYIFLSRLIRFVQSPAVTLEVVTKIRLMLWDMFQAFLVTKVRFPQNSDAPLNFEVMEMVRNFQNFTLQVKADNCRVIPGQTFYAADCTVAYSMMTPAQRRITGVATDTNGLADATDPTAFATNRAF